MATEQNNSKISIFSILKKYLLSLFFSNEGGASNNKYIKPEFINKKKIGIISPSAPTPEYSPQKVHRAIVILKEMGFDTKEGQYIYEEFPERETGYRSRAEVINSAFTDPEIGAMICKTGGSGSVHVLKFLADTFIQMNPKAVCGYSDNTMLLVYMNDRMKLVTFHGPTIVPGICEIEDLSKEYFIRIFTETQYPLEIKLEGYKKWRNGKITGKVLGGNLTRLLEYMRIFPETSFKDKILFIEETRESPESICKMLDKLNEIGILNQVKGILIGEFVWVDEPGLEKIKQHLNSILKKEMPVLYGFMSGHCKEKLPLPFGIDITVDADNLKVTFEECPFSGKPNFPQIFVDRI